MKRKHEDFLTTIESYFDSVSLNSKDNNQSFSRRLDDFEMSPTTTNFYNLLMASTSIENEKRDFMKADTLSVEISEKQHSDCLPLSSIEKSINPAKTGEIILWCDHSFVVGKVEGNSAEVFDFDGQLESDNFIFNYENEPHYIFGVKESLVANVSKYEIYEVSETLHDLFENRLKEIFEKFKNKDSTPKSAKKKSLIKTTLGCDTLALSGEAFWLILSEFFPNKF
jgi:hypothetical protein